MVRIPPSFVGVLLGVWLVLFLTGRFQFGHIKKRTVDLVLSRLDSLLEASPDLTVEEYYAFLLPRWEQMVRSSAWFIPHKTELWPMPATPQYVAQRIHFSPEWLGAFLSLRGYHLSAGPELQGKINLIKSLAPPNNVTRPNKT